MERALTFQCNDIQKELMDARSLIEAMESKEVTIEELEFLRNWNHNLREMLNHKKGEHKNRDEPGNYNKQRSFVLDEDPNLEKKSENKTGTMVLQAKLDKLSKDLKEMQLLNSPYLEDNAMELPRNQQTELFEEEVETEITKTILHLQEEIAAMQSELNGELLSLAEENQTLRDCVAAKEDKIKAMCSDWERATLELTTFLIDGSKSLRDASSQIESIACLFPCVNVWIGEHVEKAAKLCIEKEERIFLLKRCLEDAQKTVLEMDQKLNSLRGATMALTEVHQMKHMENNLMNKENCIIEDETYHPNNFLEMKRYSHQPVMVLRDNIERDTPLSDANTLVPIDVNIDIELALSRLLEVDNTIKLTCFDAENHFAFLQSFIHETFSLYKELVQDLVNNIHGMRRNFVNLKVNCGNPKFGTSASSSVHSHKFLEQENEQQMLHKIRDDLTVIIDRLNSMSACFCGIAFTCGSVATAENLAEADGWSTDFSTSSSNSLAKSALGSKQIALNGYDQCLERKTKQMFDQEFEEGSVLSSDYEELEHSCRVVQGFNCDGLTLFSLRKEFRAAYDAFAKIDAHLTAFFSSKPTWDGCTSGLWILDSLSFLKNKEQHGQVFMPEMGVMVQDREKIMQIADASSNLTREANSFFTKFEEAQATVKEADYMLNALLKSNEDAKQLTSFWKQAGNELMIQIANLVEEIKQLKSSIQLRESKIELLHNKIDFILTETEALMFLVENSFIKDMDDLCKRAYSEAILMVKETLNSTYSFRSLLEDITSKVKENGIFSFVLYCCSLGAHSNEFSRQNTNSDFLASTIVEGYKILHNSGKSYTSYRNESKVSSAKGEKEGYQTKTVGRPEVGGCDQVHDNLINENLELKKELERKEVLLKGLLFDFSLLQESASSRKDVKDEIDKLILVLNQVQDELKVKTSQLDNLLMRHRTLEGHLNETENALSISNSDLDQVRGTLDILSEENAELRMILKDLYLKKSETEQQLEEKRETVKDLENEIFRMASSAERKLASSLKDIKDDMDRVTVERDQLLDQLQSLQDKLDIAYALADEKEAICIEARQESEASKAYAKQKEEEVKILEHSIEELEYTINALEKKVYEMEEEVERHRMIRDSSEVELHNFRERLLMVESITEDMNPRSSNRRLPENEFCRQMQGGHIEVYEAHDQIKALEEEKQKLAKEIQQYREYISELVVHAEAQASQYQQKYKNLEAMVHEVRTDSSNVICGAQMSGKMEKTSVRSRGSSSPFRCIANLVQQTNMEKDQELSNAKSRIQELEALVATRQKEVCLLNTRLASVESMTHDVIRDLLGVKLEITNYADLVSQNQLQKLVEEAQQQAQQYIAMEREVLNLKGQIDDLTEERERCILEVNGREADVLAAHMLLEQVRERDQLLTVQNEMLKADKTNLQRRVAELDDMVKKLIGTQNIGLQKRQQTNSLSSVKANSFGKKLSY